MSRAFCSRSAALVFTGAAAVLALVYADLVLRARSAYLEGEKYLEWNARPELKKACYDRRLEAEEKSISRDFQAGRLSPEEYQQRLSLARFRESERLSESSLKYAYIWFKTGAELFSPPRSRWAKMSRVEMIKTREWWKKELDAKNIPYTDRLFE